MLIFGICTSLFINIMQLCCAQRRIVDGKDLTNSKRYMVYFIKAPKSPVEYDEWLCGGAILNPLTILTAAACIEDVQYMYAIAGYDKYVTYSELDNDPCTKNAKKKVTLTCVPKGYEFSYDKIEKWSSIDLGIARVESKYNFDVLQPGCSYMPGAVSLTYEKAWTEPGKDVFTMGWGHTEKWREPSDTNDYNSPKLRYTTMAILDKETCKFAYKKDKSLVTIIEKYMICTDGVGNLDPDGYPQNLTIDYDCENPKRKNNPRCQSGWHAPQDSRRNQFQNINETDQIFSSNTRRNGICQNDHGGPLVTWAGKVESVIGVVSVFRVNKNKQCIGPYLHTAVMCSKNFLECILKNKPPRDFLRHKNNTNNYLRRLYAPPICDRPPKERGFDMVEQKISWADHPDGPAENEMGPHRQPLKKRTISPLKPSPTTTTFPSVRYKKSPPIPPPVPRYNYREIRGGASPRMLRSRPVKPIIKRYG